MSALKKTGCRLPLQVAASVALGLAAATSARAGETPGYPPVPWGLDTPAGRCVVCHSLEKGGAFRVAPNLWGIIGAEKARAREWFAYSPSLLEHGGVWSEKEIDRFLATPSEFAPGTRKSIRVPDAEERRQIIEFLKKLQ